MTARRLAVDHDHKTGKIRGLLCISCNVGLGHFQDDVELLRSAILYLQEGGIMAGTKKGGKKGTKCPKCGHYC